MSPKNQIFHYCIHELESFKKWEATGVVPDDYPYYHKEEDIRNFIDVSLIQKLQWLEEARVFAFNTIGRANWELFQKFRRGEL